jgi:hypothetical protein
VSRTLVAARFGGELVTIHDPLLFAAQLTRSLDNVGLGEREVVFVEGFPVRYDKDAVSELPKDELERIRLAYGQKPQHFAGEFEFRFAVALSGPAKSAPEFLDVRLSQPTRFCVYTRGVGGG